MEKEAACPCSAAQVLTLLGRKEGRKEEERPF
jgi:hypothetical protein